MFGYVKPDLPYLYLKDDRLYKALYCAVCKNIGSYLGQRARLGLTYDIAFLSAVAHNLKGVDVSIKNQRCIVHPVVKRPMASSDEITEACAAINVILAYYKCEDDVIDSGKGRLKRAIFKGGYRRSLTKYSHCAEIVKKRYEDLRGAEKREEDRIDVVSDHFSLMMKDIGDLILEGEKSADTGDLFYFLGKWIYLVDALDDYDKDIKKKNYNPFYFAFGKIPDLKTLVKQKGNEIGLIFADIFARIKIAKEGCVWKFNHDLIDNILLKGLPNVTLGIIKRTEGSGRKKVGEKNL